MPDGDRLGLSTDRLLGQLVTAVSNHEQALVEVRQDIRDLRQEQQENTRATNDRLDRLLEQTMGSLNRILLAILGIGGAILASLIGSWWLHG